MTGSEWDPVGFVPKWVVSEAVVVPNVVIEKNNRTGEYRGVVLEDIEFVSPGECGGD